MIVKVYSSRGCPFCQMTKEFLTELGVEFEDVDLTNDLEAAKRLMEKSDKPMVLPQIEIDDQMIAGFDTAAITHATTGI